jgi:nucleoside-diphosphate-sugar epimerase
LKIDHRAGFIGGHVADYASARHTPVIFDRRPDTCRSQDTPGGERIERFMAM